MIYFLGHEIFISKLTNQSIRGILFTLGMWEIYFPRPKIRCEKECYYEIIPDPQMDWLAA